MITNQNIKLSCDNQSYIYNYNRIDTCKNFSLYKRTCYYVNLNKYYSNKNSNQYNTCPCNSEESNCTISIIVKESYEIPNKIYYLIINSLKTINIINSEIFSFYYNSQLKGGNNEITMYGNSIINILNKTTYYTIIQQFPYPIF